MDDTRTPIRAVSDPCLLGESPMWHPQEQVLYRCDIPGRRVHRLDPASGATAAWDFPVEPARPGAAAGRRPDAGDARRPAAFDPASGERTRLAEPPYDPARERFNDGKSDALGRFWVGTIYEPRDPALAALYCWSQGEPPPHGRRHHRLERAGLESGRPHDVLVGHQVPSSTCASPSSRASRSTAMAAAPMAPRSMPRAATGWRCSRAARCCGCRRPARCCAIRLPVRCPTMPCFGGLI